MHVLVFSPQCGASEQMLILKHHLERTGEGQSPKQLTRTRRWTGAVEAMHRARCEILHPGEQNCGGHRGFGHPLQFPGSLAPIPARNGDSRSGGAHRKNARHTPKFKCSQMKFVFMYFIQPDVSAILSFQHEFNITVPNETVYTTFFFPLSLQNPVCILHLTAHLNRMPIFTRST